MDISSVAKPCVMAVDFETTCARLTCDATMSCGIALVDAEGHVLVKTRIPFPFTRADIDPWMWKAFWGNEKDYPGITEILKILENEATGAVSVEQSTLDMVALYDDIQSCFDEGELVLVTDASDFDLAIFNMLSGQYTRRPNHRYMRRGPSDHSRPEDGPDMQNYYHVGSATHIMDFTDGYFKSTDHVSTTKLLEELGIKLPYLRPLHRTPDDDAVLLAWTWSAIIRALAKKKQYEDAKRMARIISGH